MNLLYYSVRPVPQTSSQSPHFPSTSPQCTLFMCVIDFPHQNGAICYPSGLALYAHVLRHLISTRNFYFSVLVPSITACPPLSWPCLRVLRRSSMIMITVFRAACVLDITTSLFGRTSRRKNLLGL